jgi:uncharacterized protein YjdB
MQLMSMRFKPHMRKIVAFLAIFALLVGILGVHPDAAVAKTEDSPAAESLTVNIDDGGKIIPVHTYTIEEMDALTSDQVFCYSSIDSMPAPNITITKGVTLSDLVKDLNDKYGANITISADTLKGIKLYATDDWSSKYDYDYLWGASRYYYPRLVETWNQDDQKVGSGCTDDPVEVEPIFATYSYQDRYLTDLDPSLMVGPTDEGSTTFRFCFGQTEDEITNNKITNNRFGRWVNRVDIILCCLDAPKLTTDTNTNLDDDVILTFEDNKDWREAIYDVMVFSESIDETKYKIEAGKITLDSSLFSQDRLYKIVIKAQGYEAVTVWQQKDGLLSPALSPDTVHCILGQTEPVTITFEDDPAWRGAIYELTVRGLSKDKNLYEVTPGAIKIDASAFSGAGKSTIVVKADRYKDTTVDQIMKMMPPTLTATPITVGQDAVITFPDNYYDWRTYVSTIIVNESKLNKTQYTVGTDKITIKTDAFPQPGDYEIVITSRGNYVDAVVTQTVNDPSLATSPNLTADTTNNTVGNAIEVTFTDDEVWRNAITEVKVGEMVLESDKYTREAGKITIDGGVFAAAGTYTIVIKANGYADAIVEQEIVEGGGSVEPLTPPILSPDKKVAIIDNPIEITFTDNETWRNAITAVMVDDVALDSSQYYKEAGKITIISFIFREAKDYTVTVKATGFADATVIQSIGATELPKLLVTGPKVAQDREYTVEELKNLDKDISWPPAAAGKPVIRSKYSAVDQINRKPKYSAEGVRIKYLLEQAGVQPGYGKVKFYSSDDWVTPLTEEEINDPERYYYPYDTNLEPVAVEPILAYHSGKWSDREPDLKLMWAENPLRLFLGQKTADELNNNNFAKMVVKMEVGEEDPTASVLTALTLSGSPTLTYSGAPFTYDLSTLTLAGTDQKGEEFDLTGQTVAWSVYSGPAIVSGSILTITGSGTVSVTATVNEITSNVLDLTVNSSNYATTAMIIKVDNGSPITVTADQINALNSENELRYYSYYKDGKMNYYTGLGAPLAAILSQYASINSGDIQSMTVRASDNYYVTFTDPQNELFNTRYYYPEVGEKVQVDTIIATGAQESITGDPDQLDTVNTMRLMMGQTSKDERTNSRMVKWVSEIDITTSSATNVPVTGIALNKSAATIIVGDSEQLMATVTPANATDQKVTWTSDNTDVATVDDTGKVTAVGEGQANITVTTADGEFTATCAVTVLLESGKPLYTVESIEDATYQTGKTSDGISTMTVNTGVSGMNYFKAEVTPVILHEGLETVVFVHLRNGIQLSLNATKADFDTVDSALAGFNVEPGDVVKVFIVDELSNADDFNPTILQ